jgi:predicted helicase
VLSDSAATSSIALRPHQVAAIEATITGLTKNDRGQLVMACGTGKTITAIKLAEASAAERVLVLVPSLSLLAQTYQEWLQHSAIPFRTVAVCSDDSVTASDTAALVAIPPVTTHPEVLAAALAARTLGRTIVFATYQSARVVAAAQTMGAPAFDLVLADEAHRTAGDAADTSFGLVLESAALRASKRVFMTATPRFCTDGGASMDDEKTYGPVFFRFGFDEAIAAGLLCGYQVVVVGITDESVRGSLEKGRAPP